MTNGIAIFDFDQTLIRQGSLIRVLTALHGPLPFASGALCALMRTRHHRTAARREALRIEILRQFLTGVSKQELITAALRIAPHLTWPVDIMTRMHWHKAQNHRILIATGGLADYVPALLNYVGIQADGLLGTHMQDVCGILTGEIAGIACTRTEKARRAQEWITAQCEKHRCEIWGYGNLPSDGPMLALADHAFEVRKGRMRPLRTGV